ncbi:ribonuclease domain-containing protein [Pseudarthrobacter sp. J75]|uniref:ribonuclease domain-containing protein n=1 Tax=unclassified Pseudarthrobacter TaxID=2647000 RepID=UPI002E809CB9|nr:MULTISPECIES: ribonuclease domain-containing protein [unclassified Pseudarthrobacter]MEE2524655.1 ribonuclease domain-containing protein [Pseudarthrobacter sp. J47]MEE2530687.1 ribonuclease domain-containing protein [Pseudarthrobacter sp. J75]
MRRLIVAVLILVAAVALSLVATQGTNDAGTQAGAPQSNTSAPASVGTGAGSKSTAPSGKAVQNPSGLPEVRESELPPEARETLELIRDGGPYPYRQDDENFGNFERILPRRASGYYREYTVETPGSDDRGARRIVAGQDGEKYYTADHYESFRFIAEGS